MTTKTSVPNGPLLYQEGPISVLAALFRDGSGPRLVQKIGREIQKWYRSAGDLYRLFSYKTRVLVQKYTKIQQMTIVLYCRDVCSRGADMYAFFCTSVSLRKVIIFLILLGGVSLGYRNTTPDAYQPTTPGQYLNNPGNSGGASSSDLRPVVGWATYYDIPGGTLGCGGTYDATDPAIIAASPAYAGQWPCGTVLRICAQPAQLDRANGNGGIWDDDPAVVQVVSPMRCLDGRRQDYCPGCFPVTRYIVDLSVAGINAICPGQDVCEVTVEEVP